MPQGHFATVVPVWRAYLDSDEVKRVGNTHLHRGGSSQYFVGPDSMDYSFYEKNWPHATIKTFADEHFQGTRAYSNWLLQPGFYQHFEEYDLILLAQTDAFLIAPLDWNSYQFDYCGAPWIEPWVVGWDPVRRGLIHSRLSWRARPLTVGNGGLSLRRPRAFTMFCEQLPKMNIYKNEDIVISYFGPLLGLGVARKDIAERIFMEDGAAGWKIGDPIPPVKGFHSLNTVNRGLEQLLLKHPGNPELDSIDGGGLD